MGVGRWPDVVADDENRAARSAAWGVAAVVFGGSAAVTWLAAPEAPLIVLVAACVCSALAAVGLYMCFASLSGTWPAGRSLRRAPPMPVLPAAPETPALPPPPVLMGIVREVDGDRLRLSVRNKGPRGMFMARVTGILDSDGIPVPGRQSWTIPWLDDGSVAPVDLPYADGRTLDFARFDPGESGQWDDRASWWFSSLPEPVIVMYKPVPDKTELAARRFVVTVRIIRTEPAYSRIRV